MTNYHVEIRKANSDFFDRLVGMCWYWTVSANYWTHGDYARTREQAEAKARAWIKKEIRRRDELINSIRKFEVQG